MLLFCKRMVPYRLLRASLSQQVNPVPRAIRANLTTGIVSQRYCDHEIIIKYKWIKFMAEVHVRAPSMHFIVVFRVKPFMRLCALEETACVSLLVAINFLSLPLKLCHSLISAFVLMRQYLLQIIFSNNYFQNVKCVRLLV